jgi:hypothetical protein
MILGKEDAKKNHELAGQLCLSWHHLSQKERRGRKECENSFLPSLEITHAGDPIDKAYE